MLGKVDGTAGEKLEQVRAWVGALLPEAACVLVDGAIHLRLRRGSVRHKEILRLDPFSAELVRHAMIRLAKAAMQAAEFADWQHWASAWHVATVHGSGADACLAEQIDLLRQAGDDAGARAFRDLRRRVAALQSGAVLLNKRLD